MNEIVQLNELIRGKGFEILEVFLDWPTKEFSTNDIRKKTHMSKATLAKWLKYLSKKGFLQLKKIGATKLYKLERDNILAKHFKMLLNIAKLQVLRIPYKCEIFLYGSAARGEDTEKSDFDLIVIADFNKKRIESEIQKYEDKLGRELKIQIFSSAEWADMERKDKAFYERVEKDKIKIK